MADQVAKTLHQYIQQLVVAMGADPRTDAELLARYADTHDEAAFATLMGRYASLVWSNCRRVLGTTPDAEDAFQATFLALARQAAVVRGDALARWLYRVSQRAALDCRRAQRRRLRREARIASSARRETSGGAGEGEQLIWEEVANLPDRLRIPVVLCYLDGKTQAETGMVLGVSVRSVSRRLDQALADLRGRLVSRGFTVTAAALGEVLSRSADSSAAPPTIASLRQLAAATAQGRVSSDVMELAARAVAPRPSRWIFGAVAVAAISGGGHAAWLLGDGGKEFSPQTETGVAVERKVDPRVSHPRPARVALAGKVTDEAGRPAAQAGLVIRRRSWTHPDAGPRDEILADGVTDADGQFRLAFESPAPGEMNVTWLTVAAPPARATAVVPVAVGRLPDGFVIRISRHGGGLAFDSKGQSLAGVTALPADAWQLPMATGADGRLAISGLDDRAPHARRLSGRVVAADTGKPFAGIQVLVGFPPADCAGPLPRVVRTDSDGRFSLALPVAPLWVDVPTAPLPYVATRVELPLHAGGGETVLNVSVHRGVVVRGCVVDSATKLPIPLARVRFFPPSNVYGTGTAEPMLPTNLTQHDGTFALAVPPSGGLLTVTAPGGYLQADLDPARTLGRLYAVHGVADLAPGREQPELTVPLERGRVIQGRAVFPDGTPVPDGSVYCSHFLGGADSRTAYSLRIDKGRFTVPGCRPDRGYTVLITDRGQRYGAVARLAWSEQPATVELEPAGSASVELRDRADRLQPGASLSVELGLPPDSATGGEPAELRWYQVASGGPADADGCRLVTGLIPGARYRIGTERRRGPGRAETLLTVPPGGHQPAVLVLPTPAPK